MKATKRIKNGRLEMRHIQRIITLNEVSALSYRQIAKALGVPRSTVSDYVGRFKRSPLTVGDLKDKTDRELYEMLFADEPKRAGGRSIPTPDFSSIHRELMKKHVTRLLLWEEYREVQPDGYGYSQFCELYNQWRKKFTVSMRQVHKAGEKMFVDYSGLTMEIIDPRTGAVKEAEIFVACLGASGYSYSEATRSQKKADLIRSHTRAFSFFKGVTGLVVPDNLKSAITKYDWYDPYINESFQDMADHYGTVVLPARPSKARDKAKVELSVKLVQRWILAKLRHRQFFSVGELNQAIRPLLDELNDRVIKSLGKSRRQLYEELDKPALKPLPPEPYVYREFKLCRVNIDYHVELEKCYYSVPYQLVGNEVEVRYTDTTVDIYHQNKRVAVHRRLYKPGSYSTQKEHMPSSHRVYAEWTPSRLINWGKGFGPNTETLIQEILSNRPHPEMGFRTCMGILNTAKDLDKAIVEAVSEKMLTLRSYRVGHFRAILKNKTYHEDKPVTIHAPENEHENVRGQAYYG